KLIVSDPKALNYILLTASGRFPKLPQRRVNKYMMGPGISSAQDSDHKRHHDLLNPPLSAAETREHVPVFRANARKLCDIWRGILQESEEKTPVDVAIWMTRATLDALGQAGFDYEFGALDNLDNELSKAYHNLM
ncbi:hypothetical protein M422DRAFT_188770, partial [Sphaerobolus stellatus SS14]